MVKVVARRLVVAVPLVFAVSIVIFILLRVAPGDPAAAIAGQNSSLEQIARIREKMGLNEPLVEQYWHWLSAALHGDLGTSLFSSQGVMSSVIDRLPATLSLTFCATILSLCIGVPVGLYAAARAGSLADRAIMVSCSFGLAIPSFWLALILVLVFVSKLGLFPPTGYVGITDDPIGWLRSIALPSLALAVAAVGVFARQTRSALIEVLQSDYIVAARARGLTRRQVIVRHGLKNAAIPVITILGLQVVGLLGGAVIVEQVFAIPGIGDLAINAVSRRDMTMIQGIVVLTALVIVAVNLLVDVVYGYVNPRARSS
jgi:peptide/nickel transport system permease protein